MKEDPAPLVVLFGPPIDGTVALTRNLRNESLNWRLEAAGLPKGHAYTIWVGNWTDGPEPLTDGGWGSGGIVGGSGRVTAAGNDCVWDLVTEWDGGFRPGTRATCDRIDVEGQVFFFLLDHGDWEPGMMLERWDPDGNPETDGDCTPEDSCDVQAAWGAFFLPLD